MIIAFIKYQDPMLFNKPTENIYEEDLDQFVPMIARDAGIVIRETDDTIILGEAHVSEDNQVLDEWGVTFPYYRCVRVIAKSQIIERLDFNIKDLRSNDKMEKEE